jgi:hypothetical protein
MTNFLRGMAAMYLIMTAAGYVRRRLMLRKILREAKDYDVVLSDSKE